MADSKVELILTADSRQAVQGIRETQKAADDLNKTVVSGQKTQVGAIESIEQALKDLEAAKKKAYDPDQIARYNKKIAEARYELDQLNKAGSDSGKQIDSLSSKISKWALGLGGAAAAMKILKEAVMATTVGINAFNIASAATKQVLHNLVTGAYSLTDGLQQVIKAQRTLNDLRLKEVIDTYKAKVQQRDYNKYYFEASDRKKTDKERIELLNKAMDAHNKMIDLEVENTKEQIAAIKELAEASKGNEKYLTEYAKLQTKLIDLDSERYSGMKRLEAMKTSMEQEEIERRADNWQKYLDEIDQMNEEADEKQRQRDEEAKRNLDQQYLYYRDRFFEHLDEVDEARKRESEAQWEFDMKIARQLFKNNQELAKEQAKQAGLLDTETPEGQKNFDELKRAASKIVNVYFDMTDQIAYDAARRRQLFDEQIAETQRSLDLELALFEDGYANNVDAKHKEIEDLKKLRNEALKNEEEAIRKQRIAESIIQGVNLATSVTQLLKEYTKIPLIGIGLAGAAITALFALFSSAKSKAASATKLAEGGTGSDTGMITGKSHAAGGEHFLSHVEVERGERWGVLNRRASEKFGKTFDYIVSSFNKDQMPTFSEPEYSNNVTVNNDGSNSRLDRVIAEQRKLNKKFNTDQIILAGSKKIIKNGNKLRIVG